MSAIEREIGSRQLPVPAAPAVFGGPWRRLCGWVIDWVIVNILAILPAALLTSATGIPGFVAGLLVVGIWPAYSIVLVHLSGETIGRIALGIRVVDLEGGRPPGWGRSTIRALIQLGLFLLSLFILIPAPLNYARVLWDPRKQGWHDRAARTIVVRVRRGAVPGGTADGAGASEQLPAARWMPPPPGPLSRSRRALLVVLTTAGVLGLFGLSYMGLYGYLEDDLVDADFGTASEPFEVGEDGAATYEVVEGTYRITLKRQGAWALTLGELRRRAYAIGVQADLLEVTQPGVRVGVGCVGDTPDGEGLAGYLFAVAPGGDFTLLRDGLSVREGSDPRIESVRRLSIICAPGLGGDVFVVGLANGLEIVRYEDASGLAGYTYAMLGVRGERGAEVRFTSVWSRVPDERWLSGTEPRDVPPQAAGSFAENGVSFQYPWEWSVREIRAPLAAGSNVGLSIAIEPPGGLYRHEYLRINAFASDGATAGDIAKERLDALARGGGTREGPTATSLGGLPAFEGRVVDHRLAGRPFELRIVVIVVADTTAYEILCQYEPDDAEIIAGCERVVDSFGFPEARP